MGRDYSSVLTPLNLFSPCFPYSSPGTLWNENIPYNPHFPSNFLWGKCGLGIFIKDVSTTYAAIFVTLLLAPIIVFAPSLAKAGGESRH